MMESLNKTLQVQLPAVEPRDTWCQRILDKVLAAAEERKLPLEQSDSGSRWIYDESERLSLRVRVYLSGHALARSDVDNLLVAIMNGLQGQVGGQRGKIMDAPLRVIRNDRHVWRAEIEKVERPHEMREDIGGELTISCQ